MNELDELTPAQGAMQELLAEEMRDTIYCTVCQGIIPEARARRQTSVCSEACKDKLDAIRLRQRAAKRCPACLHPSTPEEREDFRVWRAERGHIRSLARHQRDPTLPEKRVLARILRKALQALSEERDGLRAQLEAKNAPTVNGEPGTGIVGDSQTPEMLQQIAARVEMLTTLTTEAESVLPAKP